MTSLRWLAITFVAIALITGTLSDRPRQTPPLMLGGYRVIAADFHVHSFPLSWATLAPWDLVLEAERQDLDAIAITGHNNIWTAEVGRRFSQWIGGPTVLIGEEVVTPTHHLLALGINQTVSWRLPTVEAIDEIHRQNGVAIAAHPMAQYRESYNAVAMSKLDGSEVLHPIAYVRPRAYLQFQDFYARLNKAAVGDSDFHGLGTLGICRTYVFSRDNSPDAILEALRAGRTVVYDRDGRSFGNPDLIRLTQQDPAFQARLEMDRAPLPGPALPRFFESGALVILSRLAGLAGLLMLILFA